ncbi:hypothetical protein FQN49_004060 [Arthroderma sp. PD_2]|nr:hypothetical protein FQN49_004060 [Arthroderma sp. PD_2]
MKLTSICAVAFTLLFSGIAIAAPDPEENIRIGKGLGKGHGKGRGKGHGKGHGKTHGTFPARTQRKGCIDRECHAMCVRDGYPAGGVCLKNAGIE